MKKNQSGHHKENSTKRLLDKKLIINNLKILSGQTILDVGCGNGYMTKIFSSLVGKTGKIYALDRAAEAIEILKNEI